MLWSLIELVLAAPVKSPLVSFGPAIQSDYQIFPLSQVSVIRPLHHREAPPIAMSVLQDMGYQEMYVQKSYQNDLNGIHHVYLQQTLNGKDIVNAVANVNLDEFGRVLSVGQSFYRPNAFKVNHQEQHSMVSQEPLLGPVEALDALLNFIERPTFSDTHALQFDEKYIVFYQDMEIPMKLAYLTHASRDDVTLVWDVVIDLQENWFHAHVDAQNGQVKSLVDWVSHSAFNVYPIGTNDPEAGHRKLLVDPEHPLASPIGWNQRIQRSKVIHYNVTKGNNVYAQNNPTGGDQYERNYRPNAPNLVFDFPIDFKDEPTDYVDAAITNLFYWNNVMHDVFYLYGFNEVAGNFQDYNFGRGGKGNDAVIANAQDGSGTNNANFATPPDGQHSRMRMYVW